MLIIVDTGPHLPYYIVNMNYAPKEVIDAQLK